MCILFKPLWCIFCFETSNCIQNITVTTRITWKYNSNIKVWNKIFTTMIRLLFIFIIIWIYSNLYLNYLNPNILYDVVIFTHVVDAKMEYRVIWSYTHLHKFLFLDNIRGGSVAISSSKLSKALLALMQILFVFIWILQLCFKGNVCKKISLPSPCERDNFVSAPVIGMKTKTF